ncbi:hypothetical protein [Scytonema sp. UIC 10036]|nr:hypothetical protein [Scytonema sp. UIC 10036]
MPKAKTLDDILPEALLWFGKQAARVLGHAHLHGQLVGWYYSPLRQLPR